MGEIDEDRAAKFIAGLRFFDSSPGRITVVLNSGGGNETDGYAIYDAIRMAKNKVRIEVYGACLSIAAVILQAGTERLLAPESQFMIHHGHIDMKAETGQDSVIATAKLIEVENKRYHRILAKASGQPQKEIEDFCVAESYFDAKEAVRLGFADSLLRRRR